MQCRPGCGACCIAPSIAGPMPGMLGGKPAGVACVHLTAEFACGIFSQPERPEFCAQFKPEALFCGESREQALRLIGVIELDVN
jgi:hypothetical protein